MCKLNILKLESAAFPADFALATTPKVKVGAEGARVNLECLPGVLLSLVR